MAAFTRFILSGCVDGLPIKLTATATPGTLIHTATAVGGQIDHLYIFASNLDAAERTVTIEWGGTTDPDHLMGKLVGIPAQSSNFPIALGQPLLNGKILRMFASVANVITVTGRVNRYDINA